LIIEKDKISFIIPAFNAARFIGETLDSVLTQNYRNLEIIVVDDGSADNTVETVLAHPDERIRLYRQQNAGPSAARNLGLKHSVGEFIWYLDADDLILPAAVDLLVSKLNDNPSISGAIGQWSIMDELGQVTSGTLNAATSSEVSAEILFSAMLLRTVFPVGSAVFRRAVIEESGGWDEELWCAEDRDIYLRMLENGCRFGISDSEVFRYRHHTGNSTLNLEKVETHTCSFLEKWLGANGRAKKEFAALRPYAWSIAYLYMVRRCNSKSQAEEKCRLIEVVRTHLEDATPDSTQINGVLWEAAGSDYHGKIRSVLWPKASKVVADYCWVNGANAFRGNEPVSAWRWMMEILANRPTFLLGKMRRLFP